MSVQSEPVTISWEEALRRLVDRGHESEATRRMLLITVLNGSVGYYPRRALSLETQYRKGLLDPETGALRISHRDENPWHVRVIESDFERQFPMRRGSSTAGSEMKAVAFLASQLRTNRNMRRADAWKACCMEFPKLSERGFRSRVWPQARQDAGLEPTAPAGRKPERKS
jgi:hypothetical protein